MYEKQCKKDLPVRELNPGHPRDRRISTILTRISYRLLHAYLSYQYKHTRDTLTNIHTPYIHTHYSTITHTTYSLSQLHSAHHTYCTFINPISLTPACPFSQAHHVHRLARPNSTHTYLPTTSHQIGWSFGDCNGPTTQIHQRLAYIQTGSECFKHAIGPSLDFADANGESVVGHI